MIALIKIYFIFFKLGLFSFGGGYVLLPLLYQQIRRSELVPISEFPDILALSQMTPGPIAINAATYIGFRSQGLVGAFVATVGVISPSLILMFVVFIIMRKCKDSLLLKSILEGVRPITVGMIAVAVLYFMELTIFNGAVLSSDIFEMRWHFVNYLSLVLFIVVFILALKTGVNPIFLSIGAGLVGIIIG